MKIQREKAKFLLTMHHVSYIKGVIHPKLDELQIETPSRSPAEWIARINTKLSDLVSKEQRIGEPNPYNPNSPKYLVAKNNGDLGTVFIDTSQIESQGILVISASVIYPDTDYKVEIIRNFSLLNYKNTIVLDEPMEPHAPNVRKSSRPHSPKCIPNPINH